MPVDCVLCGQPADDVIFRKELKCGGTVFFGACCEEEIRKEFPWVGLAAAAYARIHAISCNRHRQLMEDRPVIDVVDATSAGLGDSAGVN